MARKCVPGDIVQIELEDGRHVYGQVLVHPYLAVYDYPTTDDADPTDVVSRPILFIVAVYDRALNGRTWPTVGKAPDGASITVPDFFTQDMFNPQSCKIIDVGGTMRSVPPEECEGLERAAVWEAVHVQERIRDHYAGRPNVYLKSMALRR